MLFRRRFLLSLCAASLALAQSPIDSAAEKAMREFEVPGMAVLVLKDGAPVVMKGYGVRKLGSTDPVTPKTLFGIASNSKAFTTAALAMLVEEGKLKWDDRVIEHLPSFQLHDPYVTREMTVRDLVTHRSGLGLGAGDLMYFPPTDLTRADIVARMRHVKPASSFRSRYAYNNAMYVVAGEVIRAVSGKSWEEFVSTRILKPLEMTATTTSVKSFKPGMDIAYPHAKAEGKLQSFEPGDCDNWAAAAGLNSNLEDMAKWARLQLGRGTSGTVKLFNEAQSREMWSAMTVLPVRPGAGAMAAITPLMAAYGLGWNVSDYRGRKMVTHTGGLPGMVTRVTLIPYMQLAVVVLTNQEAGGAFTAVTNTALDAQMGAEPTDWVEVIAAQQKKREAQVAAELAKAEEKRSKTSKPSLELAQYAGRYRDAWYGDVLLMESSGQLRMRFQHSPDLVGRLEHYQYDTFVVRWNKRTLLADAFVTFDLKPDGSIDRIRMAAVSPLTDFSFDFHDLDLRPAPPAAKAY